MGFGVGKQKLILESEKEFNRILSTPRGFYVHPPAEGQIKPTKRQVVNEIPLPPDDFDYRCFSGLLLVEQEDQKILQEGWLTQQVVQRIHLGYNWLHATLGGTGKGKSYMSMRVAEIVTKRYNEHQKGCPRCRLMTWKSVCSTCKDEGAACEECVSRSELGKVKMVPFTAANVIFDPLEFFDLLDKIPSGSFVVWDEGGISLDAHRWMSALNRSISYVAESFRFKQIQMIFSLPDLSMLTANARRLLHSIGRVYERGYMRVYKLKSSYLGVQWTKGLGVLANVPQPSEEVRVPYEDKKAKSFAMLKLYTRALLEQTASTSNPYNAAPDGDVIDLRSSDLDLFDNSSS